jgi:hypothetical protein
MHAPWALGLPAVAFGLLALGGRGPRGLRAHRGVAAAVAGVGATSLALWQMSRWFTEKPDFVVERRLSGGMELRRYHPRVVAEVALDCGSFEDALELGFERLFAYIRGYNSERRRIAMTTPVLTTWRDGHFTVSFTMPKRYDLRSLPRPADGRVRLRVENEQRLAVVRGSGTYSSRRRDRLRAELIDHLAEAGLAPAGAPSLAGYDSPATLPPLRRVELWIPVA